MAKLEEIDSPISPDAFKEEDLFIADGHCNANGYKLIAENLCKILIKERMFDDIGDRQP